MLPPFLSSLRLQRLPEPEFLHAGKMVLQGSVCTGRIQEPPFRGKGRDLSFRR